ncbi:MAG: hypothetical protein AVDCRST_MAG96-3057 [uncultured Segetibacter sp.]|uniref:Uncharacterized protein n=1 Tax=uncultured Segetibacter sp. TaxID=481133 RepID=A0A6J4TIH3_9BACT|nr:MAG: hypothetical protein AVDCRST_MAG96-3057 [uncultured Segetibacter sp.]
MPRDGGEPDPFSVWKGSRAALEGAPMEQGGAAREHRGSMGEQQGSTEGAGKEHKGAEGIKAAEYGLTRRQPVTAPQLGPSARL